MTGVQTCALPIWRDKAIATLVDKLLASPHYGERWARHWLDIVHYADTHGFERDQLRPNAWRYRDYLLRALNDDLPYNQFVIEHIADEFTSVCPVTNSSKLTLATPSWRSRNDSAGSIFVESTPSSISRFHLPFSSPQR